MFECPCCESERVRVVYRVWDVPVNSVLQLDSYEEATSLTRGDIELSHCSDCGFLFNASFDPQKLEYSGRYEETQGYSPTFRNWQSKLISELVDRHDLHGKRVVEIGCGKGEFLRELCEAGNNRGLGFDPAYVPGRDGGGRASVEFIRDFYGPKYAGWEADFVCCKMTLEHIERPLDFVRSVRATIGDHRTAVMFQVPDVARILDEQAFWDIYYEHCNYFSAGSLARLFRRAGFDVRRLSRDYCGQYLMLEAIPARAPTVPKLPAEFDLHELEEQVDSFSAAVGERIRGWGIRLQRWTAEGKRVAVWGAGSKAVSFLTTVRGADRIETVVDINPHRHGHYMAKTGQRIVGPAALRDAPPDVVVAMNPAYREEIAADLHKEGIAAKVCTI